MLYLLLRLFQIISSNVWNFTGKSEQDVAGDLKVHSELLRLLLSKKKRVKEFYMETSGFIH